MTNYYQEFSISENLSVKEIQQQLVKERKKWSLRLNAADSNRRKVAEEKIQLLDEAVGKFQDSLSKDRYDAELRKKGSNQQNNQYYAQQQAMPVNANNGVEIVLMQIENLYNVGNTDATIQMCNQAIASGIQDRKVYEYLIKSYEESGYYDQAFATLQTSISLFPQNMLFRFEMARIYALIYNRIPEAQNLLNEVLLANPDNIEALAFQAELDLRSGNKAKAERDIQSYMNTHQACERYRECISRMYSRFSRLFILPGGNGGEYINSKQDYEQCLEAKKKAHQLCPSNETQSDYNNMLKKGKKTFDFSLIGGILLSILIGFGMWHTSEIAGLVFLALAAWMIFSGIEPKWEIEREQCTGKRKIANKMSRGITVVVRTVCVGLFVFALNLGKASIDR